MAKLLLKVNEQSLTVEYDIPKIVENSINYLKYEVKIPDGSKTWERCEGFQIFFTGENGSLLPLTTLSGNIPSEVIKAPGFAVTVVGTGADNYFVPTESVVIQVFPNDTYNNVIDPPEGETLQKWYEELLFASQTAIETLRTSADATITQLDADANAKLETYRETAYNLLTKKYNEIESAADIKLAEIEEDAGTVISNAAEAVSDANDKIDTIERRATEAIEKIEGAADIKIIDLNERKENILAWTLEEGSYIVLPDENYGYYIFFDEAYETWMGKGQFIIWKDTLFGTVCATGTGYILQSEINGDLYSFIYNIAEDGTKSAEHGTLVSSALAEEIINSHKTSLMHEYYVNDNTRSITVGTIKNYVDVNINELSNNIISTSKNLYNEATNKIDVSLGTNVDNKGEEIEEIGMTTTDYIYLDIGTYALTWTTENHFSKLFLYFFREKKPVYYVYNDSFFTKDINKVIFEINEPLYIRLTGDIDKMNELMLVKGTELPSEYIPYKNELKLDLLPIDDEMDDESQNLVSNKTITKYVDSAKNRIFGDIEAILEEIEKISNQGIKTITESCNAWELEDGIYMIDYNSAVVTFGYDASAGENCEGWCGIFSVYTSQEIGDGKVIFAQYTNTSENKEKIVWLCVDAEGNVIRHFDLTDQNGAGGNITVDNQMSDTSTNPVQNKVVKDYVVNNFVAKEDGKGLSTNDFTDEYKTKLDDSASKKYVDEQISKIEIPESGTVDLTNYYTKEEIDNKKYVTQEYVDEVIGGIENGSY